MSEPTPQELEDRLWDAAAVVAANAYAPYSKFHVGAALLTTRGEIVSGCNVENASYGLTTCAERTAIARAVAEQKLMKDVRIQAIAVVSPDAQTCTPCGACRQLIYEFGQNAVVLYRRAGQRNRRPIGELLPESFDL
jgi:cytidine deaminase